MGRECNMRSPRENEIISALVAPYEEPCALLCSTAAPQGQNRHRNKAGRLGYLQRRYRRLTMGPSPSLSPTAKRRCQT
jgi:hypothetical protein